MPDANAPSVRLSESDAHHVRHVLRLAEGAELRVFDGRGHEWFARIARVDRHAVDVDLLEPCEPVIEAPVVVTLAVGIMKGDQLSTVVRDATALGVARIVPVASSRVVVPAALRGPTLTARLARVAASSAAQCGRAVVPHIGPVTTLDEILSTEAADVRLIAVEPAQHRGTPALPITQRPSSALVVTGPEGGWSETEAAAALAAGILPLSLGPRTLRAELAPAVVLSTLWAWWGWA